MFPLYFHYKDVSRQDPLLKLNHANVMEVPGLCKIRVVPKAAPSIKNGKLAMEIPCGHKLIQTQRSSTGNSFRSNPFLGSNKDKKGYVSDLARQSTLRGHGMSNFFVRISTIMSLLYSFYRSSRSFLSVILKKSYSSATKGAKKKREVEYVILFLGIRVGPSNSFLPESENPSR